MNNSMVQINSKKLKLRMDSENDNWGFSSPESGLVPHRAPSDAYFPFLLFIISPVEARCGHIYDIETNYFRP